MVGTLAAVLVVAGAAVAAGATGAAKANAPKLTFSGAVEGEAKGGKVVCVESTKAKPGTQTPGLQLGVRFVNFRVAESTNSSMLVVFAGPNYAPGAHPFGEFSGTSTGVSVRFTYATYSGYSKVVFFGKEGTGSATLNADKKSGTINGDLTTGLIIDGFRKADTRRAAAGGDVHVEGSFRCDKVTQH